MSSSSATRPPPSGQGRQPTQPISSDQDLDSLSSESLLSTDSEPDASAGLHTHGITSDDREEESSDPTRDQILERPNRFIGKAAAWRSYTKAERAAADALDKDRAQDLSLHLYNAYVLNRLAKDSGNKLWHPRAGWTAWPLPPKFVPRLQSEVTEHYGRGRVPLSSRVELEEVLIAKITKVAREKFYGRMQAFRTKTSQPAIRAQSKGSDKATRESDSDSDSDSSDTDADQPPPKQESSDDDKPLLGQLFEWRKRHREETPPGRVRKEFPLAIPTTNDDYATELLAPSVRNMQAEFDKLLLGLHRSRQNTRRIGVSRLRSQSRGSVSGASRSRSRSHVRDPSVSPQKRRDSTAQAPARRMRVGRRDWSDVLGMASITQAFGPEVVERARARCAALLHEDMDFKQAH